MDKNIRDYILVTAAYWGFTITDGALRMLVLLHFHKLGYTAIEIAFLFLFYEIFGIITNFLGGWIGSQFGLRFTLYSGIGLQIFALVMLALINPNWVMWIQVIYIMTSQALSGIAKDLTKMSSKSAVRLVVPKEAQSKLFKWVAILTGSKNALKGFGFFVGALLLELFGFKNALFIQAMALFVIFLTGRYLPKNMGKIKAKVKFKQLFSKSKAINILSLARFFLFGARDIWFVVALPVFFYEQLHWSFIQVGTYMACWVIGYGLVQSFSPVILKQNQRGKAPSEKAIQVWTSILTAIPAAIALTFMAGLPAQIVITGGLVIFGIVFAFNSAVHSYLVLAYTENEDVTLNVGFYYMANSAGRLFGTVTSGIVYQLAGIEGCLWFSCLFVFFASLISLKLPPVASAHKEQLLV